MLFARGTEPVPHSRVEHSQENIAEFVRDVLSIARMSPDIDMEEPDVEYCRLPDYDMEGRFAFAVTFPHATDAPVTLTVLMPGLPLDQVNYGARLDDRPTSFPRLYVDGNSWLWLNAVAAAASTLIASLRSQT